MSKWFDIDIGSFEIDQETKSVNFYVTEDDFGSVYACVSFELIKQISEKISDAPCKKERHTE